MRVRKLILALVALSAVATVLGAAALIDFDSAPGQGATPPEHWPEASKLAHLQGHSQVLVFAHPLCSCTEATLEELAKIPDARISVLFFRPGSQSGWTESRTWNQAKRIPEADVVWDDGAAEAKRFGILTSGTVLLYGTSGQLLFQGGITPSRGHAGDNRGLTGLITALQRDRAQSATPVFGCSLRNVQSPVAGIP